MAGSDRLTSLRAPLTLASVCVVVAALHFASQVMIPIALAVLLAFLLAPLVRRLERLRLPRGLAVFAVVTLALLVIGGMGWLITLQVRDFAGKMTTYRTDIEQKIEAVSKRLGRGPLAKVTREYEQITRRATTQSDPAQGPPTGRRDGPIAVVVTNPGDGRAVADLVNGAVHFFFGPLGEALLVGVFACFMLMQREDLRDRVIRLIGHGRLTVTTQALDEAATRVSQYLLAQSMVNAGVGLVVGVGLFLLKIPNAPLWGLLCALLRFIPFVGVWIGAAFPIVLSIVLPDGGHLTRFLLCMGLFVGTELLVGNFVEPYVYGNRTGVSSLAILVAAVFWTWLWGGVGLLLSTPLTAIVAVLGKHVPQMHFLWVLLSDQPVLEFHERYYQRLLAGNAEEARELAEEFLKGNTVEQLYDDVLLPALELAQRDRMRGALSSERMAFIRQEMKREVQLRREGARASGSHDDLPPPAQPRATPSGRGQTDSPPDALPRGSTVSVVCVPAHDESDEVAALMMTHLLEQRNYRAQPLTADALASEMMDAVQRLEADMVVVSSVAPGALVHARYLCKRLHRKYPDLPLLVGLWRARADPRSLLRRLRCAPVGVATSCRDALEVVHQRAQQVLFNG